MVRRQNKTHDVGGNASNGPAIYLQHYETVFGFVEHQHFVVRHTEDKNWMDRQ